MEHVTFSDTSGESRSEAIVINGARTHPEGVAAEYRWLAENYAGWSVKMQRLVSGWRKKYDVMVIESDEGETRQIYFDISDFFGKE